ncbi:helix-turn-helix domain-containing protein [Amycolatopsis sp. NPDC059027]|uniref:helix-turn-helix domain-containing protein n=1 Tax=unclassified Amycolatopsis TaxID=2618356 RepID=UPI00367014DC
MSERDVHDVRDSRVLAAMSHPLRRRLLDLLKLDGPATASVLAEKTGQAVGNISHHLKVLATSELVEEAPELARDRRERWWRRVPRGLSWDATDFPGDPIADAAEFLSLEHETAIARRWLAGRESYPAQWQAAWFANDSWTRLSAAELHELNARVLALFREYTQRELPDDGVERRPVFLVARASLGQP